MTTDRDHACGTSVPLDVRVGPALERLAVAAERIADSLGVIATALGAPLGQSRRGLDIESAPRRDAIIDDRLNRAMDPESLPVEPSPTPALASEGAPLSREARENALFVELEDLMRDFPPPAAWTVPVDAPPVPGLPSWAVPAFRRPVAHRRGPFDRAPSEIPVSVRRAPVVVPALAQEGPASGAASPGEGDR